MKNKFDQLTKDLAQSVTRRQALKKFGIGVAGAMLALLGLAHESSGKAHEPIKGCDHCNPGTNFGCKTLECYNTCYTKCFKGGE